MPPDLVGYALEDGLLRLTLQRPERGNAISLAVARELMEGATRASEDPGVRAVLLASEGPSFCVGGDLRASPARSGSALAGSMENLT